MRFSRFIDARVGGVGFQLNMIDDKALFRFHIQYVPFELPNIFTGGKIIKKIGYIIQRVKKFAKNPFGARVIKC